MNFEIIMVSTISQIQNDEYCMIPLISGMQNGQVHRDKVERGAGRGRRGLLFRRYRVSVWDGEKVLKKHSGDGCTLWMYLTPPKDGYNGKFYIMCILLQ